MNNIVLSVCVISYTTSIFTHIYLRSSIFDDVLLKSTLVFYNIFSYFMTFHQKSFYMCEWWKFSWYSYIMGMLLQFSLLLFVLILAESNCYIFVINKLNFTLQHRNTGTQTDAFYLSNLLEIAKTLHFISEIQ